MQVPEHHGVALLPKNVVDADVLALKAVIGVVDRAESDGRLSSSARS
jgi:hypothetical protein